MHLSPQCLKPLVRSKAVILFNVDLLFGVLLIGCGNSVFVFVLLCITLCPFIVLKRKKEPVALLLLSYRCLVTVYVLWLFLTVPWVGLQCVIMVFPDHTHLLFGYHRTR